MITVEQIVQIAKKKSATVLGQRRIINRLFRKHDDSNEWPISGKFNVTERAIRRARKFEQKRGTMSPYEYALFLENEMSQIVNDERNW